jgi:cephalosporin-C deacetylase
MRRGLKPESIRPEDFSSFWDETLAELGRVPPRLVREPVAHDEGPDLALDEIAFDSLGQARIRGYFLHAPGAAPRPLVVHSHGYQSQCDIQWDWARSGLDVVGVDIRGFGRSVDAVPHPSPYGYILTGWRSPETHILRGAVCDFVRAVELGRQALAPAALRVVLHGMSFAGGLGVMTEALTQAADFLCAGVPTFGWAEGRQFFVKAGSGREMSDFLHGRPELAEDLMLVLRYFDPLNFAERVTCPALIGVGLSDDVVPAKTVYAIANHIAGAHEIREFPVSHSDQPEEVLWQQFHAEWLDIARNGVPQGFGRRLQGLELTKA